MDASIVTQIDEKRKWAALRIAAQMHNGPDHPHPFHGPAVYYSDRATGSRVAIVNLDIDDPDDTGACTLCDLVHVPMPCVHVDAARYFLVAQRFVRERIDETGTTVFAAYRSLCDQVAHAEGRNSELHVRLQVLRNACRWLVVYAEDDELDARQASLDYSDLQRRLDHPPHRIRQKVRAYR